MTFEDWLREQLPRMVRFADALCGRSVSEEIVQDVAVKVHARWSKIEKLEHREAYVRRMITNEYLSWRRKWARLVPHAELDDHHRASEPSIADQHADRAELITELDRLPRKQRAVVVLRYVEGLSDREIADLLGCSEVTVRSHASRALATLRIELRPVRPQTITESEEGSHAH